MPLEPDPSAPRRRLLVPLLLGLALAVLVAAGAVVWLGGRGGDGGGGAQVGGPFTLTDGAGKTVTDRDFRGRPMLVYFGYTTCPDVCPTTLGDVAAALDTLGAKAAGVQPVFISIDPRRDTPDVVGRYVAGFSPRLVGLTGTPAQIASVAGAYRVYYAEHRTGPGPDDYSMDHSSILYLMDAQGRFVTIIRADEPAPTLAADIAKHLG